MSATVVIGAANQVVAYELRSLVGELDDVTVVNVADSSQRLEDLVVRHDPDIVLVHDQLGPTPVLHVIRDLGVRCPASAVVLLAEEPTPEVFTAAMDAGARGVLPYPASLDGLQARLVSATQWSVQMRRHLAHQVTDGDGGGGSRGRMLAIAGAKGGVGTSTVACHLAYHVVRTVPGKSVCLVDLDLEQGDIGNLLGITHRLSICDLAKVADELGQQTVAAAVHRSADGLSTLLGPSHIEDVGLVGERETRLILAALRRQFDLVVVDVGSHVTPFSAAAVEAADEVALITNPEVLALRGVHRTGEMWERVGARKMDSVRIVLNRVSKTADIQPDAAARLVPVAPSKVTLPAAFKRLEPGLNYRSPAEVKDREWWSKVDALATELGVGSTSVATGSNTRGRRRTAGRREAVAKDESGQATLEFVGTLPVVLFLMVILWQLALWGTTVVLAGHAANEAARAAALGQPVTSAVESVPSWFRSGFDVWRDPHTGDVEVRAEIPLLAPAITNDSFAFTTRVGVTDEP